MADPVTLADLSAEARRAESDFLEACKAAGFRDQWHAYRDEDSGTPWPRKLARAFDRYRDALHAYYARRDGPVGFLGSRGA